MRLELFQYQCDNCHTMFKAPELVSGEHLLLRSEGLGTMAVIQTVENPVAAEVRRIVRDLPITKGLTAARLGRATQSAYSTVYDKDRDGSPFVVGGLPRCPLCGWSSPTEWSATDPPEFVELNIPDAKHIEWDSLDEKTKRKRLGEAIADALSI